ncbi:hypothetical protein PT276_03555 [Orbaceae bacterium ESL0721]|nr:hypothetical protein [Orbaceae bacterium ESL0721]
MNFTTEQMCEMDTEKDNDYIWKVINKIKENQELTLPEESDEELFNRLKETYNYLVKLDFYKKDLIEAFLTGEAVTPGYKDNPVIKNWIEEENETPESQYEELLIIADKKEKGLL